MSKRVLNKQGVLDLDKMYPYKSKRRLLPQNCAHIRMKKEPANSDCAIHKKWCGNLVCPDCGFLYNVFEGIHG